MKEELLERHDPGNKLERSTDHEPRMKSAALMTAAGATRLVVMTSCVEAACRRHSRHSELGRGLGENSLNLRQRPRKLKNYAAAALTPVL